MPRVGSRMPMRDQINSRMRDISHTSVTSTVLTGCSTLTHSLTLGDGPLRRSVCSLESEGRTTSQFARSLRRANSECSIGQLRGKQEFRRNVVKSTAVTEDTPLLEAMNSCFTPMTTHQRSKSAATHTSHADFRSDTPPI